MCAKCSASDGKRPLNLGQIVFGIIPHLHLDLIVETIDRQDALPLTRISHEEVVGLNFDRHPARQQVLHQALFLLAEFGEVGLRVEQECIV